MKVIQSVTATVRKSDERGFTLPELMVTVLVMGILFAIATVSWRNITDGRSLTSATNQLVGDLRLAHSSATNQLTDWRVVFGDASSPTPWKVSCGGTTADYCLVKLSRPYDQNSPPLVPSSGPNVLQSVPRFLPGNTSIVGRNNFPSDNALVLTGYVSGPRASLEYNSDGSANVIASPLPSRSTEPEIRVGINGKEGSVVVSPSTSKARNAS